MEHWLDLKNSAWILNPITFNNLSLGAITNKSLLIDPDKVQTADSPFYYLASIPLNPHFPSLIDDVIPPPHAAEQNKPGNLWIGNRGTNSAKNNTPRASVLCYENQR